MSELNGKPQFDFSNLSWGDDQEIMRISLMIRKAQADADVEELQKAFERVFKYYAKLVTHIPHEWLIKNAPENIDWSNPDNLKQYVRANKVQELQDAMVDEKKGNLGEQSS